MESTRPSRFGVGDVACAALAIVPFWLIFAAHVTSPNGQPTGFLFLDMPYYAANGREIFERGNGFSYPNPFDTSPDAPAIYFQWLLWLLGVVIVKLRIDPGVAFAGFGAIGGLGTSWLTLQLVRCVLPAADYARRLFFVAMWGGGVLVLAAMAANLTRGQPPLHELLAFDPFAGQWCLNWGRNLIYPTEAVYHMLSAASWLAALRGRWTTSLICGGFLAATHPWSGLQILSVLSTACGMEWLLHRDRATFLRVCACAAMLAGLLGYYMVFLNRFPAHTELQQSWPKDWYVPTVSAMFAWGPIGCIAIVSFLQERMTPARRFLTVAAAVSIGLALHDRLGPTVQPLHFTRGYVWLPLCLLALPVLQRLFATTSMVGMAGRIIPAAFCLLAVLDNATFVTQACRAQHSPGSIYFVTEDEREMLGWIDESGYDGLLVTDNHTLGYLSAVYTGVKPFVGHLFNTPNRDERVKLVEEALRAEEQPDWFSQVDLLLIPADAPLPSGLSKWKRLHTNKSLVLFGR